MLGVKRAYQLNVILFAQEKKLDPTKKKDILKEEALPTGPKGTKTKRLQGLVQVARLSLTVKAYNSKEFELLRWKLATRGTKEFRQLYPICMTNKDFAEREQKVPGYIDGIYLMDWTASGRHGQVLMNGPALSEGLKEAKSELPQKAAKRKPTADELAAVRGPRRTKKRAG